MKKEPRNQEFRRSQAIYRYLLLAYPRSHRAEYGTAMAQLFRDQCRDAWGESGNWGLLKLWVRTAPDLATTSILEWFSAVKERKTMIDKLANLFAFRITPAATFLRVFGLVFLMIFGASVVITFLLPEIYASTARVKVRADASASAEQPPAYDPYFIQTSFEMIKSDFVLGPAIDQLSLNTKWSKKYYAGRTPKTTETLEALRQRVQLAPVKNSNLISITVYSDDKNEAAQIANAIATSYQEYRVRTSRGTERFPSMLVQITDWAMPGRMPVKPNKTLNIVLGAFGGVFLATTVGGLAALLSALLGQRSRKTAAAA